MTAQSISQGYWRSPVIWIALVVSIAFVLLALRAIVDPVAASSGFGLPMKSVTETTFVLVYAARNAILGLLAIVFVARRMVSAVTILFALAVLLPLADATILISRIGAGPELVRHAVIMVLLAVVTMLLWRRPENAMRRNASA
jgi:hypothetical protein